MTLHADAWKASKAKNKEKADFYICGSNEFIVDFKKELKENNIERINTDEWQ